ncbi:PREDICTED: uncharacterized protein LOC109114180 [Nelumbo nucifera]|uniref:Uncharacterized protein LOC109114180 n=1 Tax=Nelumbo nucifera TaxID=4432 RepID=A0A1U8Q1R3_NELNU|nr:PREDICTED: uncharacterized protein LOC109114180 [Nelumbo nucifera]
MTNLWRVHELVDPFFHICQRKYILDLLEETRRPADTPIEQIHCLQESVGDDYLDKERYQKLVGKLIYLSLTRLDIAYAVHVVNQFMHSPKIRHMRAAERILRKSTSGYCTFVGGNLVTWRSKKQNVVARSSAEIADVLTKGLASMKFLDLLGKINMTDIHA